MRKLTFLLLLNCNNVINDKNKVTLQEATSLICKQKLNELIKQLNEKDKQQLVILKDEKLLDLREEGNNIIYVLVEENKMKALVYFCRYMEKAKLKKMILETNKEGESSISFAIGENNKKAFYILAQYIDKNDKIDINGNNIIMKAISATKKDTKDNILASILQQDLTKDDMKYRNKDDDNILSLAIKHIADETEQYVNSDSQRQLEEQIVQTDKKNNLSLILNSYKNCFEINYLFNYKGEKKNALVLAIEHNNELAAKLLMGLGASSLLNLEDGEGNTPLALSIIKNSFRIMRVILDSEPSLINSRINSNGDTLIILASKSKNKLISLLEYNNELKIKNQSREDRNPEINFSKKNNQEEDAFYTCLINQDLDIADMLLDQGLDPDEYISNDKLIIKIAALGKKESIKFLLKNGSTIENATERTIKKIGKASGHILLSILEGGASFFGASVDLEKPLDELTPKGRHEYTDEQIDKACALIKEIFIEGEWLLEFNKSNVDTLYAYKRFVKGAEKSLSIMKQQVKQDIIKFSEKVGIRSSSVKQDINKYILLDPRILEQRDIICLNDILSEIDNLENQRKNISNKLTQITNTYYNNSPDEIADTVCFNCFSCLSGLCDIRSEPIPIKNFRHPKTEANYEEFDADVKQMIEQYKKFHSCISELKYNYTSTKSEILKLLKRF